MKKQREEYIEIVKNLNGDILGRKAALDYIHDSDIWAYGSPVAFSYIPTIVDEADLAFLKSVAKTTHSILTKVIAKYFEDVSYRRLFGFPEELERLITLPCDYDELLPLARFDIFLNESNYEFKFCEFNTDGSGAMSRDLEIGNALKSGLAYKEFSHRYQVEQFELFDSWVESFMHNYRQCPYAKETPTIAITDFKESGVFSDFNRFIKAFKKAGYPARFVDVRDFVFEGEKLIDPSDGCEIDAIYRRSVTSEMLQHLGQCNALIEAVAARKVCLIGHFRTTIVHSKIISIVLFSEKTRSFLTPEEGRFIDTHLPRTYRFNNDIPIDLDQIKDNKDNWILKPEDDYGAHGVYPGISFSSKQWNEILLEKLDSGYVLQEYYLPHEIDLIRPEIIDSSKPVTVESWQTMPGLYVYNGEFKGIYCRNGQSGIIALDHGGISSPSFKIIG